MTSLSLQNIADSYTILSAPEIKRLYCRFFYLFVNLLTAQISMVAEKGHPQPR